MGRLVGPAGEPGVGPGVGPVEGPGLGTGVVSWSWALELGQGWDPPAGQAGVGAPVSRLSVIAPHVWPPAIAKGVPGLGGTSGVTCCGGSHSWLVQQCWKNQLVGQEVVGGVTMDTLGLL